MLPRDRGGCIAVKIGCGRYHIIKAAHFGNIYRLFMVEILREFFFHVLADIYV